MPANVQSGTISWVDLSTPDVEGAKRFYAALFGWELTTQHADLGDYTVATSPGGRQVGGMMAQPPDLTGLPAMWTLFVVVDDLDVTLANVADAGGKVMRPPFEIPGGASIAVVADGGGAMLALISGGPEPGPYFSTDVGEVCWAELMTRDTDAAEAFYAEVFGWTASHATTSETSYIVFRLGTEEVAGLIQTPAHLPADVPDTWSVYFNVDDCREAEQRAVELGGSVLLGSTPTPMGPFAVLADPSGAAFQVMEMAETTIEEVG